MPWLRTAKPGAGAPRTPAEAANSEAGTDQEGDGGEAHGRPTTLAADVNRRPKLTFVDPGASPEETAAVVAAIERFMRETAPSPAAAPDRTNPWVRAARLDGVQRDVVAPNPWGDGFPCGR